MIANHICAICGIWTIWEGIRWPDHMAEGMSEAEREKKLEEFKSSRGVNLRLMEGVDWNDLTVTKSDLRSQGQPYDAGW